MQSPCRSQPEAGPTHPSLAVKNGTSSNFSTFRRFSIWFPSLLASLTHNMTDYVQSPMFQRSDFLEDSWQSFSMFSRKGSIFIYCTLRETQHLKANPLKELFCPKALTKNCFCSAYILPYKREEGGKKMTWKFGQTSLVGFCFVLRQKSRSHARSPPRWHPSHQPTQEESIIQADLLSLPESNGRVTAWASLCPAAKKCPFRSLFICKVCAGWLKPCPRSSQQHSDPPPLPPNIAGDQKCSRFS